MKRLQQGEGAKPWNRLFLLFYRLKEGKKPLLSHETLCPAKSCQSYSGIIFFNSMAGSGVSQVFIYRDLLIILGNHVKACIDMKSVIFWISLYISCHHELIRVLITFSLNLNSVRLFFFLSVLYLKCFDTLLPFRKHEIHELVKLQLPLEQSA